MTQKLTITVEIINKLGLHARPAALFVSTASKFKKCDVFVANGDKKANGKSIMGMMMLEAGFGKNLTITAQGEEAENVIQELEKLIKDGFNE